VHLECQPAGSARAQRLLSIKELRFRVRGVGFLFRPARANWSTLQARQPLWTAILPTLLFDFCNFNTA
ncbi:hypothetical protein GOODEAATRI_020436, partial [Goodea atripinnis]